MEQGQVVMPREWKVAVRFERLVRTFDRHAPAKHCAPQDGNDFDVAEAWHMTLGTIILDEPGDLIVRRRAEEVFRKGRRIDDDDHERRR